jgi:hypothetical protein
MTSKYGWFPEKKWETHACNCIGPQQGAPLCPCQMRGVTIKDGRYIKEIDYGPAPEKEQAR